MQQFQHIAPSAFDGIFDKIGSDWMLITAAGKNEKGEDAVNTMTASWGGMGILWGKPVAFLFVRPQRYTYQFTEQAERLSVSFFGEEYRAALRLCGTKSGRDLDKFAAAGLTPLFEEGVPVIAEARYNLICRKLYADTLRRESFWLPTLLENYKQQDYHRVYVVEIEQILKKD